MQTVEAERWWWDGLTDDEVPANVADVDTHACLSEILARLAPIREGARVLDLGCGPGRLAIPLASGLPSATVIGVDISRRMLDKARALRDGYQLENCVLLLGDGRTLPALVGSLACAYSMLLFQHLPAEASERYVQEVAERLKPGGKFAYQVVIGESDDSFLSHQCPDTIEPAMWAIDAGLRVDNVAPSGIYSAWQWVLAVQP